MNATCRWFLRCTNPATTTAQHPILGAVPCCDKCADFADSGRVKTLVFPDGLKLTGFKWSLFGYWYRTFPDTGINGEQINSLKFTKNAIADAGIVVVSE